MQIVVGTSASEHGCIFFILPWLNLLKHCDESKAVKCAVKYLHLG